MEIRTTLRRSLLLVAGILMTSVLNQVMALEWLSYLAVILSGLLFMNLWWIAICCLAYWSEKQEISMSVEETKSPVQETPVVTEPETAALFEAMVPAEISTGPIVLE